ncbi:MAG: methyltransferase [Planctomycetia bacterium]|nr:methyltransferase [Planctomycetia bacterium]
MRSASETGFDIDPSRQRLEEIGRGYRGLCVLGAIAELGGFHAMSDHIRRENSVGAGDDGRFYTPEYLVERMRGTERGVRTLLDAAVTLGVLEKRNGQYAIRNEFLAELDPESPRTYLPMLFHTMNCMRKWAQLARVVREGIPASRMESVPVGSILGEESDRASFVAAMHSVSGPSADVLMATLLSRPWIQSPGIRRFLDVGGASGTWTLAFLRACPEASAVIFDLPDAIDQARERIATEPGGLAGRITLVPGDFYRDPLPADCDFAWVSAIVHQHGREENRTLYRKIHTALRPGGMMAIRDMVMRADRTEPAAGALFAVNMLSATDTGGTFTLDEFREDLEASGFQDVRLAIDRPDMFAVVTSQRDDNGPASASR